jgi:hypothetical protein
MRRTLDEIYWEGLQALRDRLGPAGMVRFLQQFETGSDDYARERRAWVDRTSLEELRALAGARPDGKKRRAR